MRLIAILCFLFTLSTYAYDREFFTTEKGELIVVSYFESGKWHLQELLIQPRQLQEEVFAKSFQSQKKLNAFKKNRYQSLAVSYAKDANFFVDTELRSGSIWAVTQQWSIAWEDKFHQWVAAEFDKDFFVKYKIKTDCADVAFALRWIFARMHGLPAANTMAGSHVIFSQDSMKTEWQSLPTAKVWHQDKRFLAGLEYILRHAFTGTLNIDGYPIEMTPRAFKVGTIHLAGGHTMIISKIDRSGKAAPLWKLSSTVPAEVRTLFEEVMIDPIHTEMSSGGFLRMRWPQMVQGKWVLIEKDKMPLYSLEQYTPEFTAEAGNFTLSIVKRLGIQFNPKAIIQNAANGLISALQARVPIVQQAYAFCKVNDCTEGSFNYEEHSTPTRDGRIVKSFQTVESLVYEFITFDHTLEQFWNEFLDLTDLTIEGETKTLAEYRNLFQRGLTSYHPDDTVAERWALNEQSTLSAYNKKLKRQFNKRELKLKSGKVCIHNPKCKKGSVLWSEHNTYAMDNELMQKDYANYFYLKKRYNVPVISQKLAQTVYTIPKFISEPTEVLDKRRGHHNLTIYPAMGDIKRLIELSSDILILQDEVKNIYRGTTLLKGLGDFLLIDDLDAKIYSFDKKTLTIYDTNTLQKTNRLSMSMEAKFVSWLGNEHFMLSDCLPLWDDTTGEAKKCNLSVYERANLQEIFHLKDTTYNDVIDYAAATVVKSDPQSTFYFENEKDEVFFVEKDTWTQYQVPAGYTFQDMNQSFGYRWLELSGAQDEKYVITNTMTDTQCELSIPSGHNLQSITSGGYYLKTNDNYDEYDVGTIDSNCQTSLLKTIKTNWASIKELSGTLYIQSTGGLRVYFQGQFYQYPKLNGYYPTLYGKDYFYAVQNGGSFSVIDTVKVKLPRTVKKVDYYDITFECGENAYHYGCDQMNQSKLRYKSFIVADNDTAISFVDMLNDLDEIIMTGYAETSFAGTIDLPGINMQAAQEIKYLKSYQSTSYGNEVTILIKSL
jgi:hypothetical protein